MYRQQIIADIRAANPNRSPDCIQRRLLKVIEEIGENSEAYLSRTSTTNYKKKSWADFREEAVDILIVLLDVALTRFPNGSYPAGLMLELHVAEGQANPANDFAQVEHLIFEVASAVCSAQKSLIGGMEAGFIGAMGRAIRSATGLCYARIVSDDNQGLDERIFQIVQRKIAKWKSKPSTAEVLTISRDEVLQPSNDIDQVDYLREIGDRHL